MNHVNAVVGQDGHPTIAELYALAPLINTHEYLSGHGFAAEEVDALLRFQDLLEVVSACGEIGNPIAELFLDECLKRGRAFSAGKYALRRTGGTISTGKDIADKEKQKCRKKSGAVTSAYRSLLFSWI